MEVAFLLGHLAVHREARGLEVELVEHRLEQRGVDPLALAGVLALQQREQDALAEEHAGRGVGDRDAHAHRPAPGLTGHRHQAAQALHDLIDAGSIGVGAVLAEAGDAGQDDARVDATQPFVAEAEALLDGGAEVLHHHVAARHQPVEHGAAARALQVDAEAALVAVQVLLVGTVTAAERAALAAFRRLLDADDVGAPVGQQAHGRRGRRARS